MSLEPNAILVHYGEIALKGKNQSFFLRRLKRNLKRKLKSLGVAWPIHQPYGYVFIEVPPEEQAGLEIALAALKEVAGIAWYAPATRISAQEARLDSDRPDYELVEARMTQLAREHYQRDATFRVRAKRGDKSTPLTSPQLEDRLGSAIIEHTGWRKVRLKAPDQTFHLNLQSEGLYLYADRRQGIGGLPVGVSGRVLTLLSGGIDSPVAAYLAARRGCYVDFIHFTATHLQHSQARQYKISQIVQKLSNFTMRSRLHLAPYTHFDLAFLGKQMDYELIIFRRFMARVAEHLANQEDALALVTGDNLGQVASQTLENIVSNSQAVTLPMLRPLLTFDKQDIIDQAREIGTYQLSKQPYKDCCAILSKRPRTRSDHQSVSEREKTLIPDYPRLIERTLADAVCLEYEFGQPVN